MAQQTPEKQILPIAPTYPDLNALTRWAGDLTRTLQQNLATIARKANDADTVPLTGNLDASGFDITNIGNLGNISGTITYKGADIDTRYVNTTGDTMTGNLTVNIAAATIAYYVANNTVGAGALRVGTGGNTNIFFDDTHGVTFSKATKANILAGTFTGATTVWSMGLAGDVLQTNKLTLPASASGQEALIIPHGAAPASPTDGSLWSTTVAFFARLNGTTKTLAVLETAQTFTALETFTSGISFGLSVGASISDVSKGVALFSTSYGLGITANSLNIVVPTSAIINFVINAASVANISATTFTAGALNITTTGNLQKNGTTIPFQSAFESSQQTITAGGSLTIAHGLGVKPKLYLVVLQCTTAELGYSIGDEMAVTPVGNTNATSDRGASVVPDATNINIRYGANATTFHAMHKTTGAVSTITNANWKLVVRAWA